MNIFVLHKNPKVAARYCCDKHVVKMILESAQMLCAAHPEGTAPYKRTHYNHPCTVWTRTSLGNYKWLLKHAFALCKEYTHRYGKVHKTEAVINFCSTNYPQFDRTRRTPFPQAMPDEYKVQGDAVSAYRDYYLHEKSHFAVYTDRDVPLFLV
jgi:hypothetical protein